MRARAGGLALILLGGCASADPIVVSLAEPAGWARPPLTSPPCRVVVAAVEDERTNRETVGAAGNRPLYADDVGPWVAHALRALATAPAGPTGDTGPADLVTRVAIERVYARTVTSQLEGVVALRATFTSAGGATTERTYRGARTAMNWASTRAELTTLLNEALDAALARLALDAARLCP